MPTNVRMEGCIAWQRGALVFRAPEGAKRNTAARVQIIDVFTLQVATGYRRDPRGRLRLEAAPRLSAGRSWSQAKATQLIRNDARPHHWVALQLDKHAWGLFWAGGGLQHCRDLLADLHNGREAGLAVTPATSDALLQLMLDLKNPSAQPKRRSGLSALGRSRLASGPWPVVAWTSLAWLMAVGVGIAGFQIVHRQQEQQPQPLTPEHSVPTRPAP